MTISTKMYATALFEISEDDPLAYLSELDAFSEILNSDKSISNYFLKTYDQFNLVADILKSKFSSTFINFLKIIYENRVFRDLVNIRSNYQEILVENDLITLVTVTSAKELSVQSKNEIIEMVKAKYKAPLKISYDINKELISGFIIRVNSDIYDTSVKSKLDQIRQLEVA